MTLLLLLACATRSTDPAEAAPAPSPAAPAPAPAPDIPPPPSTFTAQGRIVAIGDLHGDPKAAAEVLALAGVAKNGKWTGGDTTLVQTGDTTDRGPDSSAVIDLLRALQAQAPSEGGQVVLLNGNHEVMNLQGDWRYVNPAEIEAMGGEQARKKAYARGGKYGAFLSTLPVVAKVNDTIFTHGGLTPEYAEQGLDAVNVAARDHFFEKPKRGPDSVDGPNGPYWYRGYVEDPEAVACPRLERALNAVGAKRMVVGHTTRRDGVILSRCGGRLAVIDIGISAHYGGHLGAWQSIDGDAKAMMPKGTIDLPDPG